MKRAGLVLGLAFLLLFTVFNVWNVALVKGAEVIYIRADGSIEGTAKITTADNRTYTFTDNINGSIIVERGSIVIDGAGYTIQGVGERSGTGIFLTGITNVTIRNTQVVNFEVGVWLQSLANNNNVTENSFVDNRFAIELDNAAFNSISANNITDNGNGIWLDQGSNYNSISINTITECFWDAIGITNQSSNTTITGNKIINNQYGITIDSSSVNNVIRGNLIDETESGWGIWLSYQCNQNTISGNIIRNTYYAIWLSRVYYNNIIGNNVENSEQAVRLYQASNNTFWHNNFKENTEQVYFDGDSYPNIWDNGYPSGGNFWSDYSGSDANGDGIGDSPYNIDGNNTDYYPFMDEYGAPAEKSFNVTVGETDYVITTLSNSIVSYLSFNQTLKKLSFNVTGSSGTMGYCNITVPAELMSGDFTLYKDDVAMVEGMDYVQSFNGTHYFFSVIYIHSSHMIELFSTEVVPDFAAWLFLPFLMLATLLGFTLRKRLKKQRPI